MRVIPLLVVLLLIGACATPAPQVNQNSDVENTSSALITPTFKEASAGVKKMRTTLRKDPTTDGYAERYPMRYDAGTALIYNKLKRYQQRLKKSKKRNPKTERAKRRQIVRDSWLFQDKLWAVGRAVMRMNAQDTQAMMLNMQNGLEQTAANSVDKCPRITTGVLGLMPVLPDKHKEVYKQQVRAAVMNRSRPEQYDVPADRVKAIMVKNHREISARYPNRNRPVAKSSELTPEQKKLRCLIRIEQLTRMNTLSMPERIGAQRIWLSSINEKASLSSWKTYLFYSDATKTLIVSGPMAPHLPRKLSRHLKKHPNTARVVLDSPGGLQHVGYRVGQILRKNNIKAHVAQICFSACTVALLGSEQRTVGKNAMLGFHDGVRSGVSTKTLTTNLDSYRRYYRGVPDSFLEKIRDTPHSDLWIPSEAELLEANVISNTVASPSPIDINANMAKDNWPKNPAFVADLETNSEFWQTQASRLADLQAHGTKDRTVANYIYDDHLANLRAYRISISDQFVSRTIDLRMRLLKAIMEKQQGYCVRAFVGEPQPTAMKSVFPEFYEEQQALLVDLIKATGPIKVSRWNIATAKLATAGLLRFLLKDRNWNPTARQWVIQNLGNPVPPVSDKRTCFALTAILERIDNARPKLRGALLRSLQVSMTRWSRKDRYGQRLPWADRIVRDST